MPLVNVVKKVLMCLIKEPHATMLGNLSTQRYTPFQMLIATILSARVKDEVTEPVAKALFKQYPDAASLASADPKDVAHIIHPIGFFNAKTRYCIATAQLIHSTYKDIVPSTMEQLLVCPGVGRKVANCVLVYAFGKDAIPVDTHVHRISNRLGWVRTKNPQATEQKLQKLVPRELWQQVNDTLVWHGKTTCLPLSPWCSRCIVKDYCKRVGVKKSR